MIIALVGRRIDAPDAPNARFPLCNVPLVRQRLCELLLLQPTETVVCSAACGADLLALEVAGQLGLRRRVILPTPVEAFRQTSVVDRPGEWGTLFDDVVHAAAGAGDLVVLPQAGESSHAGYLRVNQAILEEALALAQPLNPWVLPRPDETPVLAVVVWDGAPRGADDVTAAFFGQAGQLGVPVVAVASL